MAVMTKEERRIERRFERIESNLDRITVSQAQLDAAQEVTARNLDRLEASQKVTSDKVEAMSNRVEELSKNVDRVLSSLGTIGNRLGKLVEFVVVPRLRLVINAYGHDFKRACTDKKFSFFDKALDMKREICEVDMLLSNGTEAMAAEIKTTLTAGYVNSHLERLKRLREYEKETKLAGKKLYGAVVGIYIEDDARKLALKNGMYVVEILEEEKKLKAQKPARCHVW